MLWTDRQSDMLAQRLSPVQNSLEHHLTNRYYSLPRGLYVSCSGLLTYCNNFQYCNRYCNTGCMFSIACGIAILLEPKYCNT